MMIDLRRTAVLVTVVGLALLVVLSGGAGFQAAPMRADAPSVIGTISVGPGNASNGPEGVAIDPTRNHIFVCNSWSNVVYMINGDTNVATAISDSRILTPWGAAYDPINDKVYVASNGRNSVVVINAGSLVVEQEIFDASINLPDQVLANPLNNLIYVSNSAGGQITVINGANNGIAARFDSGFPAPHSMALDMTRNRLYVANLFYTADGPFYFKAFSTISYTEIARRDALAGPNGLAIRSVDGSIYTGQTYSDTGQWRVAVVSALNMDFIVPFPGLLIGGQKPMGMAYSAGSDRVYVNGYNSNTVDVIDASTNTVIATLPVGANPASGIAVNPNTGKVYVANRGSGSVSIIQDAPTAPTATPTPVNTPTPTPTPLCFSDSFEPDNTPAQAAIMNTAGITAQNHNICPNGDKDWSTFYVAGPQTLTLETSRLLGGTDTMLYLYDPDGSTLLAFNDDKGVAVAGPNIVANTNKVGLAADELASRIVYTFVKPGWYVAMVKDFNPAAFGTSRRYNFAISGGAAYDKGVWLPVIISNY
jgi:YVTN family beta-propeller protein